MALPANIKHCEDGRLRILVAGVGLFIGKGEY